MIVVIPQLIYCLGSTKTEIPHDYGAPGSAGAAASLRTALTATTDHYALPSALVDFQISGKGIGDSHGYAPVRMIKVFYRRYRCTLAQYCLSSG